VQNYNSIHLTGLLSGVNTNHGNHGNYIESLRIVYHVVIRNTIKVVACYCIDASLRLGRTCILKSEMRGSATGAVCTGLFYVYIYSQNAIKLDNTWESLDGIDRFGSPDPDPIHIFTVCVMFKCYHAIRNDYATMIDGCIAHNDYSILHSKTVFWASHFVTKFLC
jgi:hypothetical protein